MRLTYTMRESYMYNIKYYVLYPIATGAKSDEIA